VTQLFNPSRPLQTYAASAGGKTNQKPSPERVNKMKMIKLFQHITDGGAIYLTDCHKFADATIIIRLDGGPELLKCEVSIDTNRLSKTDDCIIER
jgi:hypothetical protein